MLEKKKNAAQEIIGALEMPTNEDLLSWYLFNEMQDGNLNSPEDFKTSLELFREQSPVHLQQYFQETYPEFATKFTNV